MNGRSKPAGREARAGQSHKMSIAESTVSVLVGYILTVSIQLYLYPLFGVELSLNKTLLISCVIVLLAFVKNYSVRRLFNFLYQRGHSL